MSEWIKHWIGAPRRAVVLQDGHVDPITGPRCMVKMSEGPRCGLYMVAHTEDVLTKGVVVLVDDYTWRAIPEDASRAALAASDTRS